MARKYVRDAVGRFADTPGGGRFARRVRIGPEGGAASLSSSSTARQRFAGKTGQAKKINAIHERAMAGDRTLSRRDKDLVEYASPKAIRKSLAERGTLVRPKRESLAQARRRSLAFRDVAANPATGRFVAVKGDSEREARYDEVGARLGGRRPRALPSAARKKAATQRAKLAKPAYVGRRRAES